MGRYESRVHNPNLTPAGAPTLSGSPAANLVAYFSSSSALTSATMFRFDGSQVALGAAIDSAKAFRIGASSTAAASNATAGVFQAGFASEMTSSSGATSTLAGFYAAPTTVNSAFTCAARIGYYSDVATKGAASTITRDIGYFVNQPNQGANNASISDNLTFSGTYFIHTTSASPSHFAGIVNFAGGLKTKVSVANTANPPTQAELVSTFGTAATVGSGWIGLLNDNSGGANEYLVWSDGANYWYVAGTVGA